MSKAGKVAIIVWFSPETLEAVDALAQSKTNLGDDREQVILSLFEIGVNTMQNQLQRKQGKREGKSR